MTCIEAYRKGQAAFNRREKRESNPHKPQSDAWVSWEMGWADAREAWLVRGQPEREAQ